MQKQWYFNGPKQNAPSTTFAHYTAVNKNILVLPATTVAGNLLATQAEVNGE
jgi:hypothetical protein